MRLQPDVTDAQRVFSSGMSCVVTVGGGAPSVPMFQQSHDQAATWSPFLSVDRLRGLPFDSREPVWPRRQRSRRLRTQSARVCGEGHLRRALAWTWRGRLPHPRRWPDVEPGAGDVRLGCRYAPREPAIHAPMPGTPALDPRNPDRLLLADGHASDDGGQTWAGVGALGTISKLVTTSEGWFAATSAGVVRVDLGHQAISLPDRWQVLASDFDQPSALAVAPDGSLLVGDRGRILRISPEGQVLDQWAAPLPGDQSPRVVDALAQDEAGRIYLAERTWDAYVFTPRCGRLRAAHQSGRPNGARHCPGRRRQRVPDSPTRHPPARRSASGRGCRVCRRRHARDAVGRARHQPRAV